MQENRKEHDRLVEQRFSFQQQNEQLKQKNDDLERQCKDKTLEVANEKRTSMQTTHKLTEVEKELETLQKTARDAELNHEKAFNQALNEYERKEKLSCQEKNKAAEAAVLETNQLKAALKEQTDRATDAESSKSDMETLLEGKAAELSRLEIELQEAQKSKVTSNSSQSHSNINLASDVNDTCDT